MIGDEYNPNDGPSNHKGNALATTAHPAHQQLQQLKYAQLQNHVQQNTQQLNQHQHQQLLKQRQAQASESDADGYGPRQMAPMLRTDSRSTSGNTTHTTTASNGQPAGASNYIIASRNTSETSLPNTTIEMEHSDAATAQQRFIDRQTSAPVGGAAAAQRRAELLKQRSTGSQGSRRSQSNRSDTSSRTGASVHTPQSINYKGVNIYQAAAQGSLPLCVLLWGMASPKRVNLMTPDHAGNTPLHYAALAESADVIGFLLQQSRGGSSDGIRPVDARNQDGETPLLRAMSTGVPVVIKALIEDAASDMLVTDNMGGTVFTALAKSSHLWCLNYVYHVMCTKHGVYVAQEVLHSLDVEGHSALDWASDAGDINVMEFFIRRGISPMRTDPSQRSSLFWAVKAGNVSAARYLVLCGCDPAEVDVNGQSPMDVAKSCNNAELVAALKVTPSSRGYCGDRAPSASAAAGADSGVRQTAVARSDEEAPGSPVLYVTTSGNKKVSHAIHNQCKSRLWVALLYGFIVLALWVAAVKIPFYEWILIIAVAAYVFRRYEKRAQDAKRSGSDNNTRPPLTAIQKLLLAHEKGLGVWLGSTLVLALIFLGSFFASSPMYRDVVWSYHTERSGVGERVYNPADVGGLSAAQEDPGLFWTAVALLVLGAALWSWLVWIDRDPGIIDTRDNDFEEVLAQSLTTHGPPPNNLYCRTTLVKKPIRSKYCTQTGCVVARMDHYCIWLNITVGFRNHRVFILFLLVHLLLAAVSSALMIRALNREIRSSDDTCGALHAVLGVRFFFPSVFTFFLLLIFLGLAALSVEQLRNMAKNLTTNERINMQRYSWMVDQDGKPCNKFDRGMVSNVLEFWGVPGYAIDYTRLFLEPDMPPQRFRDSRFSYFSHLPCVLMGCCGCHRCRGDRAQAEGRDGIAMASFSRSRSSGRSEGSHSSLTQENIMRLSNSTQRSIFATNAPHDTHATSPSHGRQNESNLAATASGDLATAGGGFQREHMMIRSATTPRAQSEASASTNTSPTHLGAMPKHGAIQRSSRQHYDQQPFQQQIPQQELMQPQVMSGSQMSQQQQHHNPQQNQQHRQPQQQSPPSHQQHLQQIQQSPYNHSPQQLQQHQPQQLQRVQQLQRFITTHQIVSGQQTSPQSHDAPSYDNISHQQHHIQQQQMYAQRQYQQQSPPPAPRQQSSATGESTEIL